MINFMWKVPVGTFRTPMLINAMIYTFCPDFFGNISGVTDELRGGKGNSFVIGLIIFVSGIGVDVSSLGKLFKPYGIILIFKFVFVIALSFGYISLFDREGILGVSSLAFVVALMGANPSLHISLVENYGDDLDPAAFALTALFAIPVLLMHVFGLGGGASVDWMPIISANITMVLGIILGN
ncbi:2-keto-3-deoxygluconate permease [Aerococcus viridans]